jgi:hypothetical protein
MTTVLEIPAYESGVIRVFALDVAPEDAARWMDAEEGTAHPLAEALGADPFDARFAEVLRLSDISEMGLPAYLAEGYGVPQDELAPFADRLQGLSGHAAVVMSRAFGGEPQKVTVRAPLRLVGSFREAGAETPLTDVSAETARGRAPAGEAAPPASEAPGGRRGVLLTLIALAVLALLVVAAVAGAPR